MPEEKTKPNTIWHYTTLGGFLGIFTGDKIWASAAQYLNDDLELQFGRAALAQALRDKAGLPKAVWDNCVSDLWLFFVEADRIEGKIPHTDQPSLPDTYATSFCEDGDLLSQWRAYSSGTGISIGFDRDCLDKRLKSLEGVESANLVPVVYGEEDAAATFSAAIDDRLPTLSHNANGLIDPEGVAEELLQSVGAFKHPAFREEREWRIKIEAPEIGRIRLRSTESKLIPYVEIEDIRDSITHIRVGPGPYQEMNVQAVNLACQIEAPSRPTIIDYGAADEQQRAVATNGMSTAPTGQAGIKLSRSQAPFRP